MSSVEFTNTWKRNNTNTKDGARRQRLKTLVLMSKQLPHICRDCGADMWFTKKGLICTDLCGCKKCSGTCNGISHLTKWFVPNKM